jgi:hypothetical protein
VVKNLPGGQGRPARLETRRGETRLLRSGGYTLLGFVSFESVVMSVSWNSSLDGSGGSVGGSVESCSSENSVFCLGRDVGFLGDLILCLFSDESVIVPSSRVSSGMLGGGRWICFVGVCCSGCRMAVVNVSVGCVAGSILEIIDSMRFSWRCLSFNSRSSLRMRSCRSCSRASASRWSRYLRSFLSSSRTSRSSFILCLLSSIWVLYISCWLSMIDSNFLNFSDEASSFRFVSFIISSFCFSMYPSTCACCFSHCSAIMVDIVSMVTALFTPDEELLL